MCVLFAGSLLVKVTGKMCVSTYLHVCSSVVRIRPWLTVARRQSLSDTVSVVVCFDFLSILIHALNLYGYYGLSNYVLEFKCDLFWN